MDPLYLLLSIFPLYFTGPALIPGMETALLTLQWQINILTIYGRHLPGKEMKILYLEAYCRPNSHNTDWSTHTVIPHRAELISINADHTEIKLRDTLQDGIIVDHTIKAGADEVD